jgi:TonB family protein
VENPPLEAPHPVAPGVTDHVGETTSSQIAHQVLPAVPDFARKTIRGKVRVSVRANVDSAGHVSDATVLSQNSRYFANLALEAARQWEFTASPGDWLLRFEFTSEGTTVHPSRVGR